MADNLRHVAIIMDGNGRWAERRNLPRADGHKAGAEVISEVLQYASEAGIEYLTLYAFSTENWKRSPSEVSALMTLLEKFLTEKEPVLMEKNVRLLAIGNLDKLPAASRKKLYEVIEKTSQNSGGNLVLALSYGGRDEIASTAKKLASMAKNGEIDPDKIDEKMFEKNMYLPELPPVDLMIRTSGEMRISNFLLWQLAYAEIVVTDVLWPDFGRDEFEKALNIYRGRDRRFGGRK